MSSLADEIHDAAARGDMVRVQALLRDDPSLVKSATASGGLPLHAAAAGDHALLADMLIQQGSPLGWAANQGQTALHIAATANATNTIRVLLGWGADTDARTKDGRSALQLAIASRALEACELLIDETVTIYTGGLVAPLAPGETPSTARRIRLTAAADVLRGLVRRNPASERLNFAVGLVSVATEEYGRAQLAFDRAILANPDNDRARMELAMLCVTVGQYPQARGEFRTILDHKPPPNVEQAIRSQLKHIDRRTKRWRFSGRADMGWTTDDNVNVGPDSDEIKISPILFGAERFTSLTLDQESRPVDTEGLFVSAALSAVYDVGETGGWLATSEARFYQNWLVDASDNESLFCQVSSGMRRAGKRSLLQLPVRVGHVSSGGSPLVDTYAFSPFLLKLSESTPHLSWLTSGLCEIRDYRDLNDRDGVTTSIGETATRTFSQGLHSLSLGIFVSRDATDESEFSNQGLALSMGAELGLTPKTRLYGRCGLTATDYDDRETLAPRTRRDRRQQWTAGLRIAMGGSWGGDVNYQFTDNDSTFDLYEYRRHVTTVSTSLTF